MPRIESRLQRPAMGSLRVSCCFEAHISFTPFMFTAKDTRVNVANTAATLKCEFSFGMWGKTYLRPWKVSFQTVWHVGLQIRIKCSRSEYMLISLTHNDIVYLTVLQSDRPILCFCRVEEGRGRAGIAGVGPSQLITAAGTCPREKGQMSPYPKEISSKQNFPVGSSTLLHHHMDI